MKSAKTERKLAASGLASAILGALAVLLVLSGLTLGLGARNDSNAYSAASGERG